MGWVFAGMSNWYVTFIRTTVLHRNSAEGKWHQILRITLAVDTSFLLLSSPFIQNSINVANYWLWMTVSGREQNIHECSVAAFYTRMCPAEYCCFLELQPLSLHQCFWMFHARLFVNSSTGGCLWEAPSVFRGNTSSASSLWLPPHPDSKENKPGLHHSDCTPARFFAGGRGNGAALGLDGCKFVGLAGRVWFFFLFIVFEFEWLEGRHTLLFTVNLTTSYCKPPPSPPPFTLPAGPLAPADETTDGNTCGDWTYFM